MERSEAAISFTSFAKQTEASKKDIKAALQLHAQKQFCASTLAEENMRPYSAVFFKNAWMLQEKKQKAQAAKKSAKNAQTRDTSLLESEEEQS
jgi:hypothetical protein